MDARTADRVERCERIHLLFADELRRVDTSIHAIAKKNDVINRLQTLPAVGEKVAVALYAWIGDVSEGSSQLRRLLVQSGHVLFWKCKSDAASPLRALPDRVASKGKRKVRVVAAARHILKIAYYVMRDGGVGCWPNGGIF